ncbi:hypothetical protein EGR_09003 [Echinococcus granulosus]|uniref:Uncharacterized protein n=1 Tax=Echinococcus granulosus TaxID=6210 RepID=W6U4T2_ECHGR|nr:hypothetical protein EGR_09003 [Echinococcus granulosus]EUB56153.1 hypothetical protein EGR_09003 [Echinococcus granulosus]
MGMDCIPVTDLAHIEEEIFYTANFVTCDNLFGEFDLILRKSLELKEYQPLFRDLHYRKSR